MGKLRDVIASADSSQKVTAEVRESLHMLMDLCEDQQKLFQNEIVMDLKTGKTTDDMTVPITKIIGSYSEAHCVVSDKSDILKRVGEVVKTMVSDPSAEGITTGIATLANDALTAILGIGEGSEQKTQLYMVTPDYPAIVRYDLAFWSRKISAQSIKTYCESAIACVVYKSAVDVTKLTFNDFLALYAPVLNRAYGSDPANLEEMITKAEATYKRFRASLLPSNDALADADSTPVDMANAKKIVSVHKALPGVIRSKPVKAAVGNF